MKLSALWTRVTPFIRRPQPYTHALRLSILGSLLAVALLLPGTARAEVHVAIANGRVTLSAKDATIREILAEWARVGQTQIVNAEGVSDAPLTLQFVDVLEAQALDIVLRSVAGYVAAPRASVLQNAAVYDRIFLVPTSSATLARSTQSAPTSAVVFNPPTSVIDDEPKREPVGVRVGVPMNGPQTGAQEQNVSLPQTGSAVPFAQPSTAPQANQIQMPSTSQAPPTVGAPSGSIGVSTPGMPVPTVTTVPTVPTPPQGDQPGARVGTRP